MDIDGYIARHIEVMSALASQQGGAILALADAAVASLRAGGKLLIMGNGGSAADAQHFAAELVGRFRKERMALPAIALTTDSSVLTSVGNDYGFERIFARQVEALAQPGDLVIGLSTSGRSANVVAAVQVARKAGCTTACLLGGDGGALVNEVDFAVLVPAGETPHIQEAHVTVIHLLCAMIESRMACGEESP